MRRKLVGGRKRKRVIGGRRRRMAGSGFFGNIWNGIKRAATGAHDFIKNNRLISRGLALIPDARARAAGTAAGALGYGRKRKYRKRHYKKRRLVGGRKRKVRLVGGRRKRARFVKRHRLVSRGLSHFKYHGLSNAASSLGYGRRKRSYKKRSYRKRR
jgi:hypothetical protein